MIKVPESFLFSHEKFISLFLDPIQARKSAKIKGGLVFWGQFLPTRFAEDPHILQACLDLLAFSSYCFLSFLVAFLALIILMFPPLSV